MNFFLIIAICLLAFQCEEADNIRAFKVEIHEVEGVGSCECHIRIDDLIEVGEDTMVCYYYGDTYTDTLHYRKENILHEP